MSAIGTQAAASQGKTVAQQDDAAERERVAAIDKRIATARAKAALAGWRLEVLAGGVIELSRWSRFRTFRSLDMAEVFLAEIGGRR